jgi:hypothetical protein
MNGLDARVEQLVRCLVLFAQPRLTGVDLATSFNLQATETPK